MQPSWTITKDHTFNPLCRGENDEGTTGPKGCPLTDKKIKAHPARKEFKMYDDDSELYYTGFYVGDDSEDLFAPLDNFGIPNAGCTSIHYKNEKGEFEAI